MLNNEILAVFAALFFSSILFLRFFVGFLSFGCFFCFVLGEFFWVYVYLVFCLLGLLMLCLVGTCERSFCGGVKAMFVLLICVMRREFLIFREKKCVGKFRTFLPCGQLAILIYFFIS